MGIFWWMLGRSSIAVGCRRVVGRIFTIELATEGGCDGIEELLGLTRGAGEREMQFRPRISDGRGGPHSGRIITHAAPVAKSS